MMDRWTKAKHGTNSGYNLHRYYNENACDLCKAAHRRYQNPNGLQQVILDKICSRCKSPFRTFVNNDLCQKCKNADKSIHKLCVSCGKKFKGRRSKCYSCAVPYTRTCKTCNKNINGERVFCGECRTRKIIKILEEDSICVYCENKADSIDHVLARTRGGTDDESNLVPACFSCNASKSNKLLSEWDIGKVVHAIRYSEKVKSEWNRLLVLANGGTCVVQS